MAASAAASAHAPVKSAIIQTRMENGMRSGQRTASFSSTNPYPWYKEKEACDWDVLFRGDVPGCPSNLLLHPVDGCALLE